MITELNRLVELVEDSPTNDLDVPVVAMGLGTTEYYLWRMFSSLAGMPLSEYVRRRRMTHAAGDVLRDGDLLNIAVRYGYGSTEAFGRAFQSVHGVKPGDVRRDGGPLRTQPQLRFRLTVEGRTMDTPALQNARPSASSATQPGCRSSIRASIRRFRRTSRPYPPRSMPGSKAWATPSARRHLLVSEGL
jgi:AraC-like DNA-binding protein